MKPLNLQSRSQAAAVLAQQLGRAVALHKAGQVAEAIKLYEWLLQQAPAHPDVNHFLGMAYYSQDDVPRAIKYLTKAISLDNRKPLYHINLGRVYLNDDNYSDALNCFSTAHALNAREPENLHLLGRTLRLSGDVNTSLIYLQQATALAPDNFQINYDLAQSLSAAKQHFNAMELFTKLLAIQPNNTDILREKAFSLREINQADEALAALQQALTVVDDDPKIWCELGEMLEEAGQFAEAETAFKKALAIRGGYPLAVAQLLSLKKGLEYPDIVADGLDHLAKDHLKTPVRVKLLYALGKHYDAAKDYDRAFQYYSDANDTVAVGNRYKVAKTEQKFDNLIKAFDSNTFTTRINIGNSSTRPIFIVGMPRSGTTLTEQILSSHREIEGAGELGYFTYMDHQLKNQHRDNDETYNYLAALSEEKLAFWANDYLIFVDKICPGGNYITDKMPLNFLHIGLIALTFPNARIIHCQRSPLDNCLSIFTENFHQEQNYSTKLSSLGHFYCQYHRLMRHWKQIAPVAIHDVQYEVLVNDFDNQARGLIDFCGLEWDDNCARFYQTERSVVTPSKWQVRQPIYRTSMEKWKNYANHLSPLRAALEPVLTSN